MKRILSFALLLSLAVGLLGCGGTQPAQADYLVKVEDEAGNPITGVMVQLCADVCMPKMTDEDGCAIFEAVPVREDYKAALLALPQGYAYASQEESFYFASGEKTLTVTLVSAES